MFSSTRELKRMCDLSTLRPRTLKLCVRSKTIAHTPPHVCLHASYSIDVKSVVEGMRRADCLFSAAFLDCCREIRDMERSTRTTSSGLRGISMPPLQQASGVFVGYACAEGQLADDNSVGSNGLYTTFLLKHLPVPNQNINDMYADVITDVEKASSFKQSPYVMSSVRVKNPCLF